LNDHGTASSSKKRPQANPAPRRVKEISFVIVDLKFCPKGIGKGGTGAPRTLLINAPKAFGAKFLASGSESAIHLANVTI